MHAKLADIKARLVEIDNELGQIDRVYKSLPADWIKEADARKAELLEELEEINGELETLTYYTERLMHLARNIPYSDYIAKEEAELSQLTELFG